MIVEVGQIWEYHMCGRRNCLWKVVEIADGVVTSEICDDFVDSDCDDCIGEVAHDNMGIFIKCHKLHTGGGLSLNRNWRLRKEDLNDKERRNTDDNC